MIPALLDAFPSRFFVCNQLAEILIKNNNNNNTFLFNSLSCRMNQFSAKRYIDDARIHTLEMNKK